LVPVGYNLVMNLEKLEISGNTKGNSTKQPVPINFITFSTADYMTSNKK
jgi:hypothetical protein